MSKGSNNANVHSLASVAVKRHSRDLRRYVSNRVRNRHDAEDIAQDTFEKLIRNMSEKVTDENLWAHIVTIANGKVAEFWERRAKDSARIARTGDVERLVESALAANNECYPAEGLERHEQRRQARERIETAIHSMSPKLSAALLLSVYEGLSCPEIAQRLGMNEDAVRQNIHRAHAELKKLLS